MPLFGAAYAAPNKCNTILYWLRSPKTLLNPPVISGKIQELFKAFECFSSTFQGKFNFKGLFKTVLYIQVLFKPVQTLYYCFLLITLANSLDPDQTQRNVGPNLDTNWYSWNRFSKELIFKHSADYNPVNLPLRQWVIISNPNVPKFKHFSFSVCKWNVGYTGWKSLNASLANREDPEQTSEAVLSGSALFAYTFWTGNWRSKVKNNHCKSLKKGSSKISAERSGDSSLMYELKS